MPPEQQSAPTAESPRMRRVALVAGRLLIFLAVVLFVGLWTWYFVTALFARQYSWSFWSLLLFAMFLLVLTIAPRGRAARIELGLASAKMLVEYEAPKQAEAVVAKIKEVLPAEVAAAIEEAKPRLIEEATRAFSDLSTRAAVQAAVASSSGPTTPASGGVFPGRDFTWSVSTPLTWEDLEDSPRAEAIRRRIKRLLEKPTDPSSGSVR